MSILAAAGPQNGSALGLWITGLAAAAAISVAAILRLLKPSTLGRVPAVPPESPLAPLLGVMLAAIVVWLLGPTLFLRTDVVDSAALTTASATTGPSAPQRVSTRKMVTLNAVIPTIALAVLCAGDALIRPRVRQRLGFGMGRLLVGVFQGVIAIILTLPVVSFTMALMTVIYQHFNFHPREHELLTAMEQTREPIVKFLAILSAVVVAPLWEELLFRGHLQTLIREVLARLRGTPSVRGFPVVVAGGGLPGLDIGPDAMAAAVAPPASRPVESWGAILLTSVIFASIHPLWMFPPIFVLSVCLGFAYERTGNLWAPVTMHASFNALMTVYFLQQAG